MLTSLPPPAAESAIEAWTSVRIGPGPGGGRCVVASDVSPGGLRPHLLASDRYGAVVALVPQQALLLAGDRVRVDLAVGPGLRLTVVEPAGTVAYDMAGAEASWAVHVRLAEQARLTWAAQPFVLAQGSLVRRTTRVDLATGSRCLLRETLVLGRTGERPGRLHASTQVLAAGRPLLVETLDLRGGTGAPGLLGSARVLDTVAWLGGAPPGGAGQPASPEDAYLLDDGSALWRRLGDAAHEACLDSVWASLYAVAYSANEE